MKWIFGAHSLGQLLSGALVGVLRWVCVCLMCLVYLYIELWALVHVLMAGKDEGLQVQNDHLNLDCREAWVWKRRDGLDV